ncbi:gamma-glutamyltransferase [Phenylobacterium sp.]|jgi:gamma-glutamyltranspeptidase/glutathione hydrolase|uniref:gamma-glutamyltransferase n=1 Tax=Phenylobacterium sp. TaxID=1871053 RepID=UPI002E2FC2CC|nr:gamma-glutamyltransferase [Phenylobacterium sp.]HEX3363908.1 gamma-glutamyltransferase [Phenylobacterium sp.]
MADRIGVSRLKVARAALAGVLTLSLSVGWPLAVLAQEEALAVPAVGTGGDLIGYGSIHHPTIGRDGMVVSQNKIAARIGAEILRKGGNAVDASVAVAIAETLTLPRAGNIGGGGYMLFYNAADKTTTAIEYYGEAPHGVTPDLLLGADGKLDRAKVLSFKGVTVPGTVAGLWEAHKRFGKLPWAQLIQPTIDLATKGIVMSDDEAIALADRQAQMAKDPNGAKKVYFKPDGSPYKPGDIFRNPDLAWTLKQIQAHGADGFYKGAVAEKIVAGVKAGGGIITLEDLAAYKANVKAPIWSSYRGYKIAYMPPTSAASSVAEAMNILEQFPMASYGQGGVNEMHLVAEALKIVTVDRRYAGGTPQWHTPANGLANKDFAKERAKLISMDSSLDAKTLPKLDPTPYDSPNTTQYTVADKYGNVVSNTYTLSDSFGAHVVAPGTGFLLNNSMGNFDWGARPQSLGNKIEPGKRAQSTISPLIVFKDGKPWVATGTPGGGTILATMVQMLVNIIDFKLNIAEAAERPRVYQAGADGPLELEESIPEDLVAGLKAKGHKVQRSQIIGATQSIMIGPDGVFYGAADTRRPDAEAVPVR